MEGISVQSIVAEKSSLNSTEKNIASLGRKDIIVLSQSLTARFSLPKEATYRTDQQVDLESQFLQEKLQEQKGFLGLKGKKINPNEQDDLWVTLQIIYGEQAAKTAYSLIRKAQIQAMGFSAPVKWDGKKLHDELAKRPKDLAGFNQKQILFGDNAAIKIFEDEVSLLKAGPKKGSTRRTFLKAAAALGGMALAGETTRRIVNGAPAQTTRPTETATAVPTASSLVNTNADRTPTPEGAKKPENTDLFLEIIKPFIEEAKRKRAQKEKDDPEYYHRVDRELNENRINLVIFGYSEEHGYTYENYSGAPTILSYDLKTGQIGLIHLSRDIRVPELERMFPNDPMESQRVRSIYEKGGFELMGNICERITGLAADFQMVMKDVVIRDAIDKLGDGKLVLNIPKDHDTEGFKLDRVEYGEGFIHQGTQEMNTADLMRYILAEDKKPGGKEDERSYRKNDVLDALSQKVKEKAKKDPLSMITILNFIKAEIDSKNVQADFNTDLLNRGWQFLGGIAGAFGKALASGKIESQTPEMNKNQKHVFHDPYFGDGGVVRSHNIKDNPDPQRDDPKVIEEAQQGKLPDWMLIPYKGNPGAADLVKDYWQATRQAVKETLSRK